MIYTPIPVFLCFLLWAGPSAQPERLELDCRVLVLGTHKVNHQDITLA